METDGKSWPGIEIHQSMKMNIQQTYTCTPMLEVPKDVLRVPQNIPTLDLG